MTNRWSRRLNAAFWLCVAAISVAMIVGGLLHKKPQQPPQITFSAALTEVRAGHVGSATIDTYQGRATLALMDDGSQTVVCPAPCEGLRTVLDEQHVPYAYAEEDALRHVLRLYGTLGVIVGLLLVSVVIVLVGEVLGRLAQQVDYWLGAIAGSLEDDAEPEVATPVRETTDASEATQPLPRPWAPPGPEATQPLPRLGEPAGPAATQPLPKLGSHGDDAGA